MVKHASQTLQSAEQKVLSVPETHNKKVIVSRLLWHFHEAAENIFIQTDFCLASLNSSSTLFIAFLLLHMSSSVHFPICLCVFVLICVVVVFLTSQSCGVCVIDIFNIAFNYVFFIM